MKLFGTSGIRGKDDFFSNEFCQRLGHAFAQYLIEKDTLRKVVFGMDIRESSPQILRSVMIGVKAAGFEIIYGGIIPTPCLNFFAKEHNCGGVMVTGSHIKRGQNGVKFFLGEREILTEDEAIIEKYFDEASEETLPLLELPEPDPTATEIYKTVLQEQATDFSGLKIIVDAGYGTQQFIMADVLEKCGAKVIKLNWGTEKFKGVDTELSNAFKETQKAVKKQKADLAVIYDSDGDRSIFVDHQGKIVPGDVVGALIAKSLNIETVVTPINTSSVIDHIGKKVIRTKVGSPFVMEVMLKKNLPFGFESNGGLIFAEMMYSRDGGMTAISLLNLMKKTGKTLKELVAELPTFFIEKDKVDCPPELNQKILDQMKQEYRSHQINELDGLKIFFKDDSWILFRPSGNAPEFRVFAEAMTKKEAQKLLQKGLAEVKKILLKETKVI